MYYLLTKVWKETVRGMVLKEGKPGRNPQIWLIPGPSDSRNSADLAIFLKIHILAISEILNKVRQSAQKKQNKTKVNIFLYPAILPLINNGE